MLSPKLYWSSIINLIIQQYLSHTTLCILWNEDTDYQFQLEHGSKYQTIISIVNDSLAASFRRDVVNYGPKREQMIRNNLEFDDFVEKLTMSIEKSHCESFLVFEDDIPSFVEAFAKASKYSIWRSQHNKFVFAYKTGPKKTCDYFKHYFFEDQPNILLVESEDPTQPMFSLKTNKFVGPRAENPAQMYLLNRYDAIKGSLEKENPLFFDKTTNLMGREVVLATFDYRPYVILDYNSTEKNVRDLAYNADDPDGAALLDGTETRVLMTFCEKYNCTILIDTSEADDWGVVYPNASGDGALGMVANHRAEISFVAMYSWYEDYIYLDMSVYLVRSGITCLVPAPRRLASWLLPLEPFQPTLWAAVMAGLVIEILGLAFTRQFEQRMSTEPSSWLKSSLFGIVTTLKLFVSQSSSEHVSSVSIRVVLFACFMNDIIITSIYSGGLASILTIPSMEEVADSLERLESHQLKWSANSEAWVMTIRGTDDARMDNILKNFQIYTTDEMREMALTENMGFTLERLPFGHFAIEDFLTHAAVNRLKLMLDDIYFQYTVAFVARVWPLLERFDGLTYMWHSSGFDKFWEWKIVNNYADANIQKQVEASMYTNYDDIGPVRLAMSNFAGILVIWVLGIVLSVLVFLGELTFHRMKTT